MAEENIIQQLSCSFEYGHINGLIKSVQIIDSEKNKHTFSGITVKDEMIIAQPFGCPFRVIDISDKQWDSQNFEVEFLSGYSREGVFTANKYELEKNT